MKIFPVSSNYLPGISGLLQFRSEFYRHFRDRTTITMPNIWIYEDSVFGMFIGFFFPIDNVTFDPSIVAIRILDLMEHDLNEGNKALSKYQNNFVILVGFFTSNDMANDESFKKIKLSFVELMGLVKDGKFTYVRS